MKNTNVFLLHQPDLDFVTSEPEHETVEKVLFDFFNDRYSDPVALTGFIREELQRDDTLGEIVDSSPAHIVSNLSGQSQEQSQKPEPVSLQSHDEDNQVAERPGQDVLQLREQACVQDTNRDMNHHGIQQVYSVKPDQYEILQAVMVGGNVQDPEDRAATPEEVLALKAVPRWKSLGFSNTDVRRFAYTPYQKMVYVTCDRIPRLKLKNITIANIPKCKSPIVPCLDLTEPPQGMAREKPSDDIDVFMDVIRKDPQDHKTSWDIGVESSLCCHSVLSYPKSLVYEKRIRSSTLSCKRETQMYHTVNLSKVPTPRAKCGSNSFKHAELIISEFPTLTKEHVPNLLMVKSSTMLYLGKVCTIQDVNGLLVHKVFANDVTLLQLILDMHTCLQVHPFVPRTFTLQLMKTPFLHNTGVGMFVGEAVGQWNLGCVNGMQALGEASKLTLAHHVMQCLLRAQMLSLRVLGFTMKRIQPARIWRWSTGFRVDFIGCLVDTVHVWQDEDPVWGGREGLATIHMTMKQLGLCKYLPEAVLRLLVRAYTSVFHTEEGRRTAATPQPRTREKASPCQTQNRSDPNDEHLLHDVYNLCMSTEQSTSVNSDFETILGSEQYQEVALTTLGSTIEPYGPFYIQQHNQCFRWNKAIIVEPDVASYPVPAQVLTVFKHARDRVATPGRVRKVPNPKTFCARLETGSHVSLVPRDTGVGNLGSPLNQCDTHDPQTTSQSVYYGS